MHHSPFKLTEYSVCDHKHKVSLSSILSNMQISITSKSLIYKFHFNIGGKMESKVYAIRSLQSTLLIMYS